VGPPREEWRGGGDSGKNKGRNRAISDAFLLCRKEVFLRVECARSDRNNAVRMGRAETAEEMRALIPIPVREGGGARWLDFYTGWSAVLGSKRKGGLRERLPC